MANEQLSERERLALAYIVQFRRDNFDTSPTVDELYDYLNQVLPRQKHTRPALVSKEQVFRVIRSLRRKGLLLDPEVHLALAGRHRNIIPTQDGYKAAKKIARAGKEET